MKLFLGQLSGIYLAGQVTIIMLPIMVVLSILVGLVTKLMIFAFNTGYSIAESLISILF